MIFSKSYYQLSIINYQLLFLRAKLALPIIPFDYSSTICYNLDLRDLAKYPNYINYQLSFLNEHDVCVYDIFIARYFN